MYVLAKFQLKNFWGYTLQSSRNQKIILYSEYMKIKHRHLLKQMYLTNGVMYRLEICTIVFAVNWAIDYWVSYSSTLLHHHKQSWYPWRNINHKLPFQRVVKGMGQT